MDILTTTAWLLQPVFVVLSIASIAGIIGRRR